MTEQPIVEDLRADAIRVLTAAARRTSNDGSPRDFADFLAEVLAATAANIGGTERLLAGRPGSWEASLVRSLMAGTLGNEPSDLLRSRTEPSVVTLNVAELLDDLDAHLGLMTVDEAMDACAKAHQDDDPEVSDVEEAMSAIETHYIREFAAYAERFAAAVQSAATDIDGLSLPVLVDADTDPWSAWWSENAKVNPRPSDEDTLVLSLWEDAHDEVDLPTVDKRPLAPAAHIAGERSHSREGAE